ncbi:MAG TPA: efflux RND transporter periplasmic adaptor subunit [Gemmatimonadaceae bacterium]|nr:efflux RND transporter periplasmic adaptor subunit [Gemmatimonadaceae bacterium]
MKRFLLLAPVTLLALAGCKRGDAAAVSIETEPVQRRTIVVDAQATGTVEPINIIEVKSKSSGQIVQMPVEVGTDVQPGDLLVQLDTRDVKNQYDQAAADLAAARARLDVAEAQRKRNQELYDAKIITRQEFESTSLEYENAKAALIRSQSSLDLAQQRLDEATVRAPVVGTVIEKPVTIGQVITSASTSASGGTTILKMADLKKVRVRALVNETDIGSIRSGLTARVVVDAYPTQPFFGTVEQVEPQAVVQQSVTMFPVLVSLNNDAGLLKPGMNGEVSVEITRREDVLAVPNDAVRTPREVQAVAGMLGLDPDSVQAQLRAQMGRRMNGEAAAPAGDTTTAGAQVRVAPGDVALDQPPGGDRRGAGGPAMPQVTDEQCRAVDAAFAKQPAARKQLDSLRQLMRGGSGDMQALRAEQQRIYAALGVEPRTAGACLRRGQGTQGGAGSQPGVQPANGERGGRGMRGQRGQGGATAFGGAGRGRTGLVFVVRNGRYEPRMVRLGVSDFDYTEVLSGLEEGDEVALLAAAAMQAQREERNQSMRDRMGGGLPGVPGGGGRGGRGGR